MPHEMCKWKLIHKETYKCRKGAKEKKKTRSRWWWKKWRGRSDGAEKLGKWGLGVRVHTDDDDQRDETIVSDDLRFSHCPCRPLLQALARRSIFRGLRSLWTLTLRLQRNPWRHWNFPPFFFSPSKMVYLVETINPNYSRCVVYVARLVGLPWLF